MSGSIRNKRGGVAATIIDGNAIGKAIRAELHEEVAAMVYVGDVYALREQSKPTKNDGWGKNSYQ